MKKIVDLVSRFFAIAITTTIAVLLVIAVDLQPHLPAFSRVSILATAIVMAIGAAWLFAPNRRPDR